MTIFLLYPTFYIEFTNNYYTSSWRVPSICKFNSFANQIAWQGYGSASIGDQITLVALDILWSSLLTIDCDAGASSSARLRFPTELSAMTMYSPRAQKSCCRLRGGNTSPPPYSNPTITPLENPCNTQLLMSCWSDWKIWLWFRSHDFLYFGCDLCS